MAAGAATAGGDGGAVTAGGGGDAITTGGSGGACTAGGCGGAATSPASWPASAKDKVHYAATIYVQPNLQIIIINTSC